METIEINLGEDHILITLDGEGSGMITESTLKVEDPEREDTAYNHAMDGLEAVVLAHACAGLDVTTPMYVAGLKTAIEAISNNS